MGTDEGLNWQVACYHIEEIYGNNFVLIPFGSQVYGTRKPGADYDYIAIIFNSENVTGREIRFDNCDVQVFSNLSFQQHLNEHKIQALEVWYYPGVKSYGFYPDKDFTFELNLSKLRHSLSEKASNSFVKAKKKIEKEKDYYIGWKSLFHSLRILDFGTQIATINQIKYDSMNHYWKEILEAQRFDWEYFKDKYQPIYNELAANFRKAAPK